MDKYYTPEIEEFYIGFEYELLDLALNMKDKEFRSDIIVSVSDIKNAKDLLRINEIRVKYLDKEDIERLGFEYNLSNSNNEMLFTIPINKEDYSDWIYEEIELFYGDTGVTIIDHIGVVRCVQAYIKNKSELKTLLKQLGVKYEKN